MLPVEHNDPINAKILAISEDKIEGFVREPFEEIAQPLRRRCRCCDGADCRNVARGNNPARPANFACNESCRGRAGGVESS